MGGGLHTLPFPTWGVGEDEWDWKLTHSSRLLLQPWEGAISHLKPFLGFCSHEEHLRDVFIPVSYLTLQFFLVLCLGVISEN